MLTLDFMQIQDTADVSGDGQTTNAAAGVADSSGAKQTAVGGLGANLVSTVRSFLPFVSKAADAAAPPAAGKKTVKVRLCSVSFSEPLWYPTISPSCAKTACVSCMLCSDWCAVQLFVAVSFNMHMLGRACFACKCAEPMYSQALMCTCDKVMLPLLLLAFPSTHH